MLLEFKSIIVCIIELSISRITITAVLYTSDTCNYSNAQESQHRHGKEDIKIKIQDTVRRKHTNTNKTR